MKYLMLLLLLLPGCAKPKQQINDQLYKENSQEINILFKEKETNSRYKQNFEEEK